MQFVKVTYEDKLSLNGKSPQTMRSKIGRFEPLVDILRSTLIILAIIGQSASPGPQPIELNTLMSCPQEYNDQQWDLEAVRVPLST